MKKYNLIEATQYIVRLLNINIDDITSIEFEDGSGKKFVYVYKGKPTFINLKNYETKKV